MSIVDPVNRSFQYVPKEEFLLAVGARYFATPWMAIDLRVADRLYAEEYEASSVAPGAVGNPNDPASPSNPRRWLDANTYVTNRVELSLGVTFFVPPLRER